METPIYSFQSADGLDRDVSPTELQDWVRAGKLKLDDTVTNFFSGQRFRVREVIQGIEGQFATPPSVATPAYAAYPRGPVQAGVIPDLSGFNWGAFVLYWCWGPCHKKTALLAAVLLGFIPFGWLIQLGIAINAGTKGNKWAWESGRFNSPDEFRRCEAVWRAWAIPIFVLELTLGFIVGLIGARYGVHRYR
jgi:hypothetical protein